jgi:2-succinyl-5-enolpyruvyl-6-hydroxy-3-cyclohexene-1-carboxylate synthase
MSAPGTGDVAATFCATLVDTWVAGGLTRAVVAPGSRSTPLALALAADPRVTVSVHHDERSAGFVGLGVGLATGVPAVVLTTSGTAAVEVHPAVVEAHQAGVPLIVCTADRPGHLRDLGAPQTIDQRNLYGVATRAFFDPGVPRGDDASGWRSFATGVWHAAGDPPGPVQVNLAFDEPLVGTAGDLPDGPVPAARPTQPAPSAGDVQRLVDLVAGRRGVIVAGGGVSDPDGVTALAAQLGWPVLADARSGCRIPGATTIAHADALLRHPPFAAWARPEVVVRAGSLLASKVVGAWFDGFAASGGVTQVGVTTTGVRYDPGGSLTEVIAAEPGALAAAVAAGVPAGADPGWLAGWRTADDLAAGVLAGALDRPGDTASCSEPAVARTVARVVGPGAHLVVSSSMPVRDLEWYAEPRNGVVVHANRGANGIDGVVSTALGVALGSGVPVAVLVGDVAMVHDTTALVALNRRGVDLTVVVVDNDGGGIFSFLDQARLLDKGLFEELFGTPHGVDLQAVATAMGLPATTVSSPDDLASVLAERARPGGGASMVVVRTTRADNVAVHQSLHAGVADALAAGGWPE